MLFGLIENYLIFFHQMMRPPLTVAQAVSMSHSMHYQPPASIAISMPAVPEKVRIAFFHVFLFFLNTVHWLFLHC